MTKIALDKLVTVKPTLNEETGVTAEPFIGRISDNRNVSDDGTSGYYVVEIPETGDEHEALAAIVREIRPVVIEGYNDAPAIPAQRTATNPETGETVACWWDEEGQPQEAHDYLAEYRENAATAEDMEYGASEPIGNEGETRYCPECRAERDVKTEYVTNAKSDPTAAYGLACGHHTIDL